MKLEALDNQNLRSGDVASNVVSYPASKGASKQPEIAQLEIARIQSLRLTGFRNYATLQLNTDAKAVLLTGTNGAGKTNLLEALSLLAPGRGLRRAPRDELGYRSQTSEHPASWAIFAELNGHEGPAVIGTGLADANEKGRSIRINHAPATQGDLLDCVSVSWLTPQMDGLFLASPSQRRRFLDRLAMTFDPAHNGRLLRYEKAWRERNHMLQEQIADESWLQAVEQLLAETGVALMATRAQMLADICQISQSQDSQFPAISGCMTGQVADGLEAGTPAIDIEDQILSQARQNRGRGDSAMPGAHDADFTLTYKGRSAHLASTGEQKALLISMVLAHAKLQHTRLGKPPILLLDDVVAHLDEGRREELFGLCQQMAAQTWYSGADATAFEYIKGNAAHFWIENGQLRN